MPLENVQKDVVSPFQTHLCNYLYNTFLVTVNIECKQLPLLDEPNLMWHDSLDSYWRNQ